MELIDYLCRFVFIELQKTDFYRANESMMHSFFLSELLDHHIRDVPTILRRAQSLGWNLSEYLRIMTVFQEHSVVFDKMAQLISKQVHQLLPGSRWVIYDGHIVFLLCLKTPDAAEFRGDNPLRRYLEVNGLSASLSRCFHSLVDTGRFYRETLAAWQLGQGSARRIPFTSIRTISAITSAEFWLNTIPSAPSAILLWKKSGHTTPNTTQPS